MNDLVCLVMEAAATELLNVEAAKIDQEVQRLMAERECAPAEELRRSFAQRFLELLKRRGEVARKAANHIRRAAVGGAARARAYY
jgi:hypothetical protein